MKRGLNKFFIFILTVFACVETANANLDCRQTVIDLVAEERHLHEYADGVYKNMLARSERETREAKDSQTPVVADIITIGGGPHSGIVLANARAEAPTMRSLVLEKTRRLGTFHKIGGFQVNSEEGRGGSGNTFPGVPVQPAHVNLTGKTFLQAETLGDVTVLAHHFNMSEGRGAVWFEQTGTLIEENQIDENWHADYRVTTADGIQAYSDFIIVPTGMGDPHERIEDQASRKLIAEENEAAAAARQDPTRSTEYAPGIQSVDQFLTTAYEDAKAGRNTMSRYGDDTFIVVGGGHGSNIGVEAIEGWNELLNPSGIENQNKIIWVGQKAKNGEEFVDNLREDLKPRYGKISKGFDGRFESEPGHVVSVVKLENEIVDGVIKPRFQVTILTPDGKSITKTGNRVLFSTGYLNNVMNNFAGLDPKKTGQIELRPVMGNRQEFTDENHEPETIIAHQVYIAGKAKNIFVVGNANDKNRPMTPDEKKITRGGYIQVLAPLSASLGAKIGAEVQAKLIARGAAQRQFQLKLATKLPAPRQYTLALPKEKPLSYAYESVTLLDLRIKAAQFFAQFRLLDRAINILIKNEGDTVKVNLDGLDKDSATEFMNRLQQNHELLRLVSDAFRFGKTEINLELPARKTGAARVETMTTVVK